MLCGSKGTSVTIKPCLGDKRKDSAVGRLDVKKLEETSAASCWRTRLSVTHLKLDSHQHNADMSVWTVLYPAGNNNNNDNNTK